MKAFLRFLTYLGSISSFSSNELKYSLCSSIAFCNSDRLATCLSFLSASFSFSLVPSLNDCTSVFKILTSFKTLSGPNKCKNSVALPFATISTEEKASDIEFILDNTLSK